MLNIKHLILVISLLLPATLAVADDYNPDSPAEPYVSYSVTVAASPSAGGYVSGGGTLKQGQSTKITASVYNGYTFSFWTLNGAYYSNATSLTYTVGSTDAAFIAYFAKKQSVTVATNPSGAGSVSGAGTYSQGSQINVSTTPYANYTFKQWLLNGNEYSTATSFYYTVGDSTAAFVAQYEYVAPEEPDVPYDPESPVEPAVKQKLDVVSDNTAYGTVSGAGYYYPGTTAYVSATANSNYVFDHWTLNGEYYSASSVFSYTMTAADATFKAYFKAKRQVTVSTDPSGAGSVSGAGTYVVGTGINVSTSPYTGYIFSKWTLNGYDYGTATSFSYTVGDSTADFKAVYISEEEINPYSPDSPEEPVSAVTITATPPDGYYFVSWNDGVTQNPRTVWKVDESKYTPIYAPITFDINTEATICDGEYYPFGSNKLTIAGIYKETFQSIYGADSVVTLKLNVLPSYRYEENATIQSGESYEFQGEFYTESGLYTKKYVTVLGCDSVYQLFLVVNDPTEAVETSVDASFDGEVYVFTTSGKLVSTSADFQAFIQKNTPYIVVRRGKDGKMVSEKLNISSH